MKKASLKLLCTAALMIGALAIPAPSKALAICNHHVYCLDVYQPVICSNGVVYGNSCYAYIACATDCVPYGGATE